MKGADNKCFTTGTLTQYIPIQYGINISIERRPVQKTGFFVCTGIWQEVRARSKYQMSPFYFCRPKIFCISDFLIRASL